MLQAFVQALMGAEADAICGAPYGGDRLQRHAAVDGLGGQGVPRLVRVDVTEPGGLAGPVGQWPDRVWAVEGANAVGRPVTGRLLADAERVLDVPAKLAARARVFDTGHGRKTDINDAHAVVMVALRDKGLRELTLDPDLQVLRLLCDRRDDLPKARASLPPRSLSTTVLEKILATDRLGGISRA
jgi:hypothetical protein